MQTDIKKTPLVVISREFGISAKEMRSEADKLSDRDRMELASAIARQRGIPAEECDWEMVAY